MPTLCTFSDNFALMPADPNSTAIQTLYLVNNTTAKWVLKGVEQKLMNSWEKEFPAEIYPMQRVAIQIEFYWSIFQALEDEFGKARYHIENTDYEFMIEATGKTGKLQLLVHWGDIPMVASSAADSLAAPHLPLGIFPPKFIQDLHWGLDEYRYLILADSHIQGKYTTSFGLTPSVSQTIHPATWMQQCYPLVSNLTLNTCILPGTIDCAFDRQMNTWPWWTYASAEASLHTQIYSIEDQLKNGARFLQIRPSYLMQKNEYYAGSYYQRSDGGVFGASGTSIKAICDIINAFTQHHNELLIIHVSDGVTIDESQSVYTPFNQTQWTAFCNLLSKELEHLASFDHITRPIASVPISTFYSGQTSTVLVVADTNPSITAVNTLSSCDQTLPKVSITLPLETGVYSIEKFGMAPFNRSLIKNTMDVAHDQFHRLQTTPLGLFYPMPWHRYSSSSDAAYSAIGAWNNACSLISLSYDMNRLVQTEFLSRTIGIFYKGNFPNALLVEGFDAAITYACIAVNLYQAWSIQPSIIERPAPGANAEPSVIHPVIPADQSPSPSPSQHANDKNKFLEAEPPQYMDESVAAPHYINQPVEDVQPEEQKPQGQEQEQEHREESIAVETEFDDVAQDDDVIQNEQIEEIPNEEPIQEVVESADEVEPETIACTFEEEAVMVSDLDETEEHVPEPSEQSEPTEQTDNRDTIEDQL